MGVVALKPTGEMDAAQAAKYIGERLGKSYSVKTLYNRISEGQGPRRIERFGRLVFLAADLDAWIDANSRVKKAFCR